jgi:hypothetical protein
MRPWFRAGRALTWRGVRAPVFACLLVFGCEPSGSIDPALPDGALLSGNAPALRRVLTRLERLGGTPLGREAGLLRARLDGCTTFVGLAPDGDVSTLVQSVGCRDAAEEDEAVRRLRGEDDIAVLLPIGSSARLAGSLRVGPDGGVTLNGEVDVARADVARFVLPDSSAPGPPVLSPGDALLHARFRPEGGIDVASLVPEGSQGDSLFRLKSELFAGAILEGIWEAAIYLPPERHRMTPLALALDFRVRSAAVGAIESFIDELESTWPVHRSPFSIGPWKGACLLDLRILPEFAPCYVATDRALVLGWNPPSVRVALTPAASPDPVPRGGVVVHLGRFGEADRRLRESVAAGMPSLELDYAWERLIARSWQQDGRFRVHVVVTAKGAS